MESPSTSTDIDVLKSDDMSLIDKIENEIDIHINSDWDEDEVNEELQNADVSPKYIKFCKETQPHEMIASLEQDVDNQNTVTEGSQQQGINNNVDNHYSKPTMPVIINNNNKTVENTLPQSCKNIDLNSFHRKHLKTLILDADVNKEHNVATSDTLSPHNNDINLNSVKERHYHEGMPVIGIATNDIKYVKNINDNLEENTNNKPIQLCNGTLTETVTNITKCIDKNLVGNTLQLNNNNTELNRLQQPIQIYNGTLAGFTPNVQKIVLPLSTFNTGAFQLAQYHNGIPVVTGAINNGISAYKLPIPRNPSKIQYFTPTKDKDDNNSMYVGQHNVLERQRRQKMAVLFRNLENVLQPTENENLKEATDYQSRQREMQRGPQQKFSKPKKVVITDAINLMQMQQDTEETLCNEKSILACQIFTKLKEISLHTANACCDEHDLLPTLSEFLSTNTLLHAMDGTDRKLKQVLYTVRCLCVKCYRICVLNEQELLES